MASEHSLHDLPTETAATLTTNSSEKDGRGASTEKDRRELHTVSFDDGLYPDEYRDPLSTPSHRYHLYNIIIALNCFLVSLFASAYLFVAPAVQAEFQTTEYLCESLLAGLRGILLCVCPSDQRECSALPVCVLCHDVGHWTPFPLSLGRCLRTSEFGAVRAERTAH